MNKQDYRAFIDKLLDSASEKTISEIYYFLVSYIGGTDNDK